MRASEKQNGTVAVEVEGLTKSFDGKVVVRNLSMRVMRGQIYGFLGPNGSGKTTTLRMVCGLLTPDGGRGTALGYDILTERDKIKRHVGYMTQRFSLYQDLSIQENLEFVARVHGLANPEQEAQAAIARLGLRRPRAPACRHAVGRLEAAPRARRLHPAQARACCCSTSPPPASIPRRGASSGARSTSWPPKA